MNLAIDLGDKRCGIALEIEGVVIPKKMVLRLALVRELKKLFKEYNIHTIVVGLPYDLYGKRLKQLEKTKKFINTLKEVFPDKKVEGIDERFTSFEADNILKEIGVEDTEGKKDALSASLILESYLNNK